MSQRSQQQVEVTLWAEVRITFVDGSTREFTQSACVCEAPAHYRVVEATDANRQYIFPIARVAFIELVPSRIARA